MEGRGDGSEANTTSSTSATSVSLNIIYTCTCIKLEVRGVASVTIAKTTSCTSTSVKLARTSGRADKNFWLEAIIHLPANFLFANLLTVGVRGFLKVLLY